mmetsp:Transcript_85115/g.238364  ORF Transcript_85115/g.238364 Transcript_85115/m.238364 type:complete len:478 (-) Transcript_85115:175-1608(-)
MGLVLHLLRVGHDRLQHGDHAGAAGVLLVLGEARRAVARVGVVARRRDVRGSGLGSLLDHGIDLAHAVVRLAQDDLRQPVVGHRLLIVGVLCLADLRSPLHLLLHVRHRGRSGVDVRRELVDGLLQVRDLGLQAGLLVVGLLRRTVVLVELIDAPIAMRNLVLLLLAELGHHLVDLLLDLGEGVEAGPRREKRQCRRAGQRRAALQGSGRAAQALLLFRRLNGHSLEEGDAVDGGIEVVEGRVGVEDGDGVLHGGDLGRAVLDALRELLVAHRALLLEVGEEGAVDLQLRLRVLELLEGLGVLLLQRRDLLVQLRDQLPARLDLFRLRRLQRLVVLSGLLLLGLGLGEVLLKVLLHLLQHAEDLPALRGVALVAGDGQEGPRALRLPQKAPQHRRVRHGAGAQAALAELDDLRRLELPRRLLHEARLRVVLLQHGDCLVAGLDRLDEVDLVGMERLVLLHPQRARLLQRGLVAIHLV